MTPLRCERCGREASTWSVDRLRRSAGCPCGEVIEVFFDDDDAIVLSASPRAPAAWTETPASDTWHAEFRSALHPAMFGTWAAVASALVAGLVLALSYTAPAFTVLLGALGLAGVAYAMRARGVGQRLRTQIDIGHGRIRIVAPGKPPTETALDEVRDCIVAEGFELLADARVRTFVLSLRLRDGRRQQVPLFVADAAEAQFVMNRINEVLAVEGRDVGPGYRGEPLSPASRAPFRWTERQDGGSWHGRFRGGINRSMLATWTGAGAIATLAMAVALLVPREALIAAVGVAALALLGFVMARVGSWTPRLYVDTDLRIDEGRVRVRVAEQARLDVALDDVLAWSIRRDLVDTGEQTYLLALRLRDGASAGEGPSDGTRLHEVALPVRDADEAEFVLARLEQARLQNRMDRT